jgi:hypothetical protein
VYAADATRRLLADEGIGGVHFRALHHRCLLYFFGPYIPVDVMVAGADAEAAHACLRRALAPELRA